MTSALLLLTALFTAQDRPTSTTTGTYAALPFPPGRSSYINRKETHRYSRLIRLRFTFAALHRFTTLRQRPNFQMKQHLTPCLIRGRIRPAIRLKSAPGQLRYTTILALTSTYANFSRHDAFTTTATLPRVTALSAYSSPRRACGTNFLYG